MVLIGTWFKMLDTRVRCNMCTWEGNEEDLVLFEDEDGFGKGCPKCETDAYLMDLEVA